MESYIQQFNIRGEELSPLSVTSLGQNVINKHCKLSYSSISLSKVFFPPVSSKFHADMLEYELLIEVNVSTCVCSCICGSAMD